MLTALRVLDREHHHERDRGHSHLEHRLQPVGEVETRQDAEQADDGNHDCDLHARQRAVVLDPVQHLAGAAKLRRQLGEPAEGA